MLYWWNTLEQWIVEKYNTKVDTKNVNLFIKLYWVQNQTYMIEESLIKIFVLSWNNNKSELLLMLFLGVDKLDCI